MPAEYDFGAGSGDPRVGVKAGGGDDAIHLAEQSRPECIEVVPCDDAAVERVATRLHLINCPNHRKAFSDLPRFHQKMHLDEAHSVLRAAGDTPYVTICGLNATTRNIATDASDVDCWQCRGSMRAARP